MSHLPLYQRFALNGSVVMLAGMALIGSWVASSIEESVTRNSTIATSICMESFIAPLSQELASADALSPAAIERLRAPLLTPTLADRIVSVKIWKHGRLIAFSADPALIGQLFPPGKSLCRAWQDELTATFDRLDDAEDAGERARGVALLEVYTRGYVLKGVGAEQLTSVLRGVAARACYISPNLAARVLAAMHEQANDAADPIDGLTRREEDILRLVSRSLSNKEVGREFDLQEKTVKNYMTNIMQKLQARNRVEAALMPRKRGL
jgi:DNA-binding CsgD family transcriptional regulator